MHVPDDRNVIGGFQAEEVPEFTDAELSAASDKLTKVNPWSQMTVEEMLARFSASPTGLIDSSDLGDGFAVLNKSEKNAVVGVPFLALDYVVYQGDQGQYASIRVALLDGSKRYRLNDGSAGMYTDLVEWHTAKYGAPPELKRVYDWGLVCKHGLSVSRYKKKLPNGKEVDGETFYWDTSA
jgi:hypothetical protein